MKYSRSQLQYMALVFMSAREDQANTEKCIRFLSALSRSTGFSISQCLAKIEDMSRG